MAIEHIDNELCNGCGICANICSRDVIRIDTVAKKAVIKYYNDCIVCGFCFPDCPKSAITFTLQKGLPPLVAW